MQDFLQKPVWLMTGAEFLLLINNEPDPEFLKQQAAAQATAVRSASAQTQSQAPPGITIPNTIPVNDPEPQATEKNVEEAPTKRDYITGLKPLAKALGCSLSTVCRIKKSGIIDDAIAQTGRIVITDFDLAFELIKQSKYASKISKCRK